MRIKITIEELLYTEQEGELREKSEEIFMQVIEVTSIRPLVEVINAGNMRK